MTTVRINLLGLPRPKMRRSAVKVFPSSDEMFPCIVIAIAILLGIIAVVYSNFLSLSYFPLLSPYPRGDTEANRKQPQRCILDDKHPDGGLLHVFSDYLSVVCKPSATD